MCYSQRQRFFFRGYVYHREKSSCSRTEKTLSFLTANDNSIHMKIFFSFLSYMVSFLVPMRFFRSRRTNAAYMLGKCWHR
jgi:hypothetical protein